MKIICILPTGDWAEINPENLPRFTSLDQNKFEALCNGELDISEVE